ncbi:MAG: type II secretion system F family protein [Gammaproteobacteria bacterium]
MPTRKVYFWYGIDSDGKQVLGELSARNLAEVKIALEAKHILPLRVTKAKSSESVFKIAFSMFRNFRSRALPQKILRDFMQELATLVNASIPLVSALAIMEKSAAEVNLKALIAEIKHKIERGESLSSVLCQYSKYFDALFCGLIKVGEESGTLDQMLTYLAKYQSKIAEDKRCLKKILLYPCLVLSFALIITAALLIFVIPELQNMFANFGAVLPLYTRCIIALAHALRSYGWIFLLFIASFVVCFVQLKKRNLIFAFFLDNLVLRLPYFGEIFSKIYISRIARVLAITFPAGLPLQEALDLVVEIIPNVVYKNGLKGVRDALLRGESISDAFTRSDLFSPRVLELVAIGAESGSLDAMFHKITCFYDEEISYKVSTLQTVLEPVIMLVLGVLIGGIVIGMYLPIFQLGKVM